ncbi:SigE family RNA polymerase sigma factor [Actinocatenispora rupis]|uniref:RNA polymerase sigma24 factor n=1 Tax=Actinocatenispora rupis TaxID=519421 RepID=A0A8J3NBN9_9ACTN|nr:SigE family RNA polymerase sigma factor [Actinocatenispora rupis]GID11000.1 RNA polymerase sigma24 factor [Actinocatenispora rupis]
MTRRAERDDAFREYVAARADAMRFTAYLLAGDWHTAEDITQTAFVKLYLAWDRIDRRDSVDAYLRRIVTRTFLNEQRRTWRHRERLTDAPPDVPAAPDPMPEQRMLIWRALVEVPPKQRAALVLRYWEDMSVAQAADVLGCSVGNVKSQCARGLDTLRAVLRRQIGDDADRILTEGASW